MYVYVYGLYAAKAAKSKPIRTNAETTLTVSHNLNHA